jgi:hypothetical protein
LNNWIALGSLLQHRGRDIPKMELTAVPPTCIYIYSLFSAFLQNIGLMEAIL